jgi:uncharacterized protein (DUF2267 family)
MADQAALDFFEHHVLYAFWMLGETRDRLDSGRADQVLQAALRDDIIVNALIESFSITARGLIDFFNDKDGAKASEFTKPGYQPWVSGEVAKADRTKLSTQIAHLTRARTTVAADKIDAPFRARVYNVLAQEVASFRSQLQSDFVPLWPAGFALPVILLTGNEPPQPSGQFQSTTTSTGR